MQIFAKFRENIARRATIFWNTADSDTFPVWAIKDIQTDSQNAISRPTRGDTIGYFVDSRWHKTFWRPVGEQLILQMY